MLLPPPLTFREQLPGSNPHPGGSWEVAADAKGGYFLGPSALGDHEDSLTPADLANTTQEG